MIPSLGNDLEKMVEHWMLNSSTKQQERLEKLRQNTKVGSPSWVVLGDKSWKMRTQTFEFLEQSIVNGKFTRLIQDKIRKFNFIFNGPLG